MKLDGDLRFDCGNGFDFFSKKVYSSFIFGGVMTSRLQELERKIFMLERILRLLPGNIFWKDANNIFQGCNDRNARMIGYSSSDYIVGKTNHDIFEDKEFAESLDINDRLVLETGKELILEEPGPNFKNDQYDIWLSTKTPLKDDHGQVVGLLGNAVSLSERKMQEEQLLKALASAEAANNAKNAFLSNLGHDIRTPLSGMVGVMEELKHVLGGNDAAEGLLGLLEESAQSFLAFFNTVLEAVDAASYVHDTDQDQDFDVGVMVSNCASLFKSVARAKNITLSIQIAPDCPLVRFGNKHILTRILMNLLGNAMKYTEKGSVTVVVQNGEDSGQLVIKVVDTGIGIPGSSYEHIFERFTRLSPATEGKYPGSGMGLFLVKEYTNFLAGSVEVDSTVGKGSTFTVSLPCKISKKAVSTDLMSNRSFEQGVPTQVYQKDKGPARLKVLVVEDNNIAGMALQCMLVRQACEVVLVVNGEQALQHLTQDSFDLVFMDLGLPDMTGTEVVQKASEHIQDFDPANVVILSGHVTPSMRQDFFAMGIDTVCVKPLAKDDCEKLLQKFMTGAV